jgi:hypothetical protein
VNPTEIAGDTALYQTDANGKVIYKADGTPAKKRGRKPGATSTAPKPDAKPEKKSGGFKGVDALAMQFQVLNSVLAWATDFPDFEIDDSEAKMLAGATALSQ